MKLSPLTSTKSIPLYTEDRGEYWSYLTSIFGAEERRDGLFHFLIDIFENIDNNSAFAMNKPLIEIVSKIRNVLATMSDNLHVLYDSHKEDLENLSQIIQVLDYTIQKVPTTKSIKARKKLNIFSKEGLEEDVENEETEEDDKEEKKTTLAIGDQTTDVQRVIQFIRDHIIKNNLSIRQAFKLPDHNVDKYFEFHEFKAMVKDICGKKASYSDIENATEFIFKGTLKLEEDKKKQDVLAKLLDKSYREKPHDNMINFKFFEQIMKKILKKAGYKAAIKKRERDEEAQIQFVMPEENLAVNITNDYRNFVKLFLQSNDLLDETSEFEILFLPYFAKMLARLKDSISKGIGAIANETDEALLKFFINLKNYVGRSCSYQYLLKIFTFIINCFDPKKSLNKRLYKLSYFEVDKEHEIRSISLLYKIQQLINDAGVTKYTIEIFSKINDEEVLDSCINFTNSMLMYSNQRIQK